MKTELHYYDIFPKVVPSERETQITIKPLGWHAAFPPACKLNICPLDEGRSSDYPGLANVFTYDVSPDADGCIRFRFSFFGEQQFYVRIASETGFSVQLSVYVVKDDLVGRYPYRGDTHMHSRRSDGKEAPAIVCANYRRIGYDFLAITDHYRYYPSIEAIETFRGVPIEMELIPGEEVHLPKDRSTGRINDVHIVNFGGEYSVNALVESEYSAELVDKPRAIIDNIPPIISLSEYQAQVAKYMERLKVPGTAWAFAYASCCWIFDRIREADGLGIFCHPYWINDVFQVPRKLLEYMMETHPFDAFEVLGGEIYFEQNGFQTIQYYDDRAKGLGYPVVGATDAHGSVNNPNSRICSSIVFSKQNERRALISAIKDRYSVAVDSRSEYHDYVGEPQLARYACFLEQEYFPLHDELCFEEGRAMKDYACGIPGARETLEHIYGRVQAQREKYFAFD
ncbi:hypothetical protein FACS18948_0280 [Clostridia bacterium]|nr:hypothetical protein FACS18948_0280 [Clostridia bacterium]